MHEPQRPPRAAAEARKPYASPTSVSRPVLLSLFAGGGSCGVNGPPCFGDFRRPRR